MVQAQVAEIVTPTAVIDEKTSLKKKIRSFLKEAFAFTSWVYLLIKLFVFDVDYVIVKQISLAQRLYPFKLFMLLGLIAISWLVVGGKRLLKLFAFTAVYPAILFWRVFKHLCKNWPWLLVFAPAIESIFFTIKWRFVLGTLTLLSALAICLTSNDHILVLSMVWMGIYLVYHYVMRLGGAFRLTSIFARVGPVVEKMWRGSINSYKSKEFTARSGPGAKPEDYEKKHIENIKELYLQNLMWAYLATKLEHAVASRRTDVYFIVALIYSFLLTIVIFSFEYFALFKIDETNFHASAQTSLWAFLVLSFNTLLHTTFATIAHASNVSIALANLELIAGLVIGLCLVFILLTSSRERYRQDVKDVATKLSASATQIERFLDRRLKMRLIDAEAKIISVDPSFCGVMQSMGRTPPPIASEARRDVATVNTN